MATYIQRAQALIDAAIDGTSTAAQQQRVAAAFENYAPDIVAAVKAARPLVDSGQVDENNDPIMIPDASPLTNAEKAEVFVNAYVRWGKSVLRAMAEKSTADANTAAVKAAGDAAEIDL